MKALIFTGKEQVRHETVPDPVLERPGDVLVRVRRTAICGSDLHIYHGREEGLDAGTVMGHEFAGDIVAIGRDVKNFKVGDRVCCPFTINCGDCFYCKKGLTARCPAGRDCFGWVQNGQGLQGAQAEMVRVPCADSTLVKIPAGMNFEEAVLLGDNFAAGFFCADMAEAETGGVYAVVGCGMVGLVAVLAARQRGAREVIAIDNLPYRLELAKTMGATAISTPDMALSLVHQYTDGRGADAVLEAVGSSPAQALAFQILRPCGILATVGMHTTANFAFAPFAAYNKNLTYKTGRCPARFYMEKLIPILEQHREKVRHLITHRLPLDQGVAAYRLFANKAENCTKVILEVG